MTLKIGEKVRVKFWFRFIDGVVIRIKNGLYTIEADGKSFQFAKRELDGVISK